MLSAIKTSSTLRQNDLLELITGNVLALRIKNFAESHNCQSWQKSMRTAKQLDRYSNAPDVPVNRIGMTLFETENKKEKLEQYFNSGQKTLDKIHSIFGQLNPLQKLIGDLEECWQSGCDIQQSNHRLMNPGIIRSFEASKSGGLPPHVDSLLKDLPDNNEFRDMRCQLAANLYFEVTKEGGELELWDYQPEAKELEEMFDGNYDFIDRSKIPVVATQMRPEEGELIIFRSNCIHSVKSCQGGMRSAASCFIGYYDTNRPLTVWA